MCSTVPMICLALREALELSAALNFDITARWIPRKENEAADALSREMDASDWGIEKGLLQRLISHFGVRIGIDMYASDAHHVSSKFVSQYYTPGCFAVHAPRQDIEAARASRCRCGLGIFHQLGVPARRSA
jgi:hypothetical protein